MRWATVYGTIAKGMICKALYFNSLANRFCYFIRLCSDPADSQYPFPHLISICLEATSPCHQCTFHWCHGALWCLSGFQLCLLGHSKPSVAVAPSHFPACDLRRMCSKLSLCHLTKPPPYQGGVVVASSVQKEGMTISCLEEFQSCKIYSPSCHRDQMKSNTIPTIYSGKETPLIKKDNASSHTRRDYCDDRIQSGSNMSG